MISLPPLFLSLFLPLLSLPFHFASGDSAYEVLRSHGLPIGLLPKGVSDFSIDADGLFQARLDAPCTATFESEVRYNASVVGTISHGQITALSGISAQDLFLWFPVLAIRLDDNTSGIIHFDVGVVDKRFPLSLFEDPPDCTPLSPSAEVRLLALIHDNSDSPNCTQNSFFIAENQSDNSQYEIDRDAAKKAAI